MSHAFCSSLLPEDIKHALSANNVEIIPVLPLPSLPVPVQCHPDMLMFRAQDDLWIMEKSTFERMKIPAGIKVVTDGFAESGRLEYPYDIRFNAALLSGFLFCKEKYISPEILKHTNAKVVDVKQGYARCSMCIVNEYSFITSDPSLKKAGDRCGLDVLMISPGNITLTGYDYGFIGGASALCQNALMFFGDIKLHPDYAEIHDFARSHGVEVISLGNHRICDYGGALFC